MSSFSSMAPLVLAHASLDFRSHRAESQSSAHIRLLTQLQAAGTELSCGGHLHKS